MKVIEHGEVLEFTCTGCGCIYAAGRKEVRDAGFYLHVECPECGTDNKYDGGKNERIISCMDEAKDPGEED